MTPGAVDLSNCEREPIHIPAAIQPHGAMLVCREEGLVVEQASANLEDYLGVTAQAALGANAASFFTAEAAMVLDEVLHSESIKAWRPLVLRGANGATFDADVHRSSGAVVIELEPHTLDVVGYHPRLRTSIARLQTTSEIADLCVVAAQEIRTLTGFDRVMVYRFDADWHGEVIAEAKRDDLEPFLGLHYPASDIPAQARRLYTLNWLRLIADAHYRPVPLTPPMRPSGAPLDMSHCVLRSVSPIHCEYLTNMGVRASMSVSLVRDGQLWGLIACHHYEGPKVVPFAIRDSSEFLAQTLSWHVSSRARATEAACERDARAVEADIVRAMSASSAFVDGLATPSLLALTRAEGAAVVFEDEIRLVGKTPSPASIRDLLDWIGDRPVEDTFSTDQLPSLRDVPQEIADVASGVLAVAISREHREFLVWFRPSVEREVSWAGNPNKVPDPASPRLSPRGSFSLWLETVRGRSLPWQPWEVEAASNLRRAILTGVRKRAAELRALADRLAEADRLKDDFLAAVSHELRTPLNAISGWARILRQRTTPEKYAHALEVIERNARAQTQLIEDLLDVSRMTSGKLSLEVQPVDLAEVIRIALEAVNLSADAKNIAIRPMLDDRASVIVGDPKRLQQVVWNLVTNAIKFTAKGGHIDVVLRRVSSDVEIVVRDNGQGIGPDLLPYVFDPFRQGTVDRRGLGLGLAICRHITELHGGRIAAQSAGPGTGATFTVTLPISAMRPATAPAHLAEEHAPHGEALGQPLSGVRLLIVEDEPDSREILEVTLTQWGATVYPFPSAPAALASLASLRPDAIIADIGLPEMDGHELIRQVRRLSPEEGGTTPAVAITAFARTRDRTQALMAGFQSYVPKPLEASELLAVLRALLGRTTPV